MYIFICKNRNTNSIESNVGAFSSTYYKEHYDEYSNVLNMYDFLYEEYVEDSVFRDDIIRKRIIKELKVKIKQYQLNQDFE